jgi:hypothetical protein
LLPLSRNYFCKKVHGVKKDRITRFTKRKSVKKLAE